MKALFTIFGIPVTAVMLCMAGRVINTYYEKFKNKFEDWKEKN